MLLPHGIAAAHGKAQRCRGSSCHHCHERQNRGSRNHYQPCDADSVMSET
ncbi:MAG: hypothetical protein PUE39_05705 [bacterium]|nr:hypothetical protein [bacterium]